jgi:hypothetical protein
VKQTRICRAGTGLLALGLLAGSAGPASAWRSGLYPADWAPGVRDAEGRLLHDFSHAGYRRGERPIPENPPGLVLDVTQPPYAADPTGAVDATAAIQQALDDAGAAGGGVVYLPPGTYAVAPQGLNDYALRIRYSGVVLRGAGPDRTVVHNTATEMRQKEVIKVRPPVGDWGAPLPGTSTALTADLPAPATVVPVAVASGFAVGNYVVLRADATPAFIAEHGMSGLWNSSLQGVMFFREVVAVDVAAGTLTLDTPTRYVLKMRDGARAYRVAPPVEEVGVEHLALSMAQNTTPGFGDADYAIPGSGAYQVHNSHMLEFYHAVHGWARNLHSVRAPGNPGDVHMLSMGILTQQSRCITVQDCVMQKPLYRGGGGNGYMFRLRGNDCLIQRCEAIEGRHNYTFFSLYTSGNVVHRSIGRRPRLSSDFHGHLSMANLFDTMLMDGDWLQGVYRDAGTVIHGHTTTESVYWNTFGAAAGRSAIVESRAWGHAYVIGTRGPKNGVLLGIADGTAPEDFLEGRGLGDTLEPESLYLDQLARRIGYPDNEFDVADGFDDSTRYNAGDPADLAWFAFGDSSAPTVIDDQAGLGEGRAMALQPGAGGGGVIAPFGRIALRQPGDWIRLELRLRLDGPIPDAREALGIGLYDAAATTVTADFAPADRTDDDAGYAALLSVGGAAESMAVISDPPPALLGEEGATVLQRRDAGGGLDDNQAHAFSLTVTRGEAGLMVTAVLDGALVTGADPETDDHAGTTAFDQIVVAGRSAAMTIVVDSVRITAGITEIPPTLAAIRRTTQTGMQFQTLPTSRYQLQFRPAGEPDAAWQSAGAERIGTGSKELLFDPAGFTTNRSYRIREITP